MLSKTIPCSSPRESIPDKILNNEIGIEVYSFKHENIYLGEWGKRKTQNDTKIS